MENHIPYEEAAGRPDSRPLFTVGHSNQDLESFLGLLQSHGIRRLADIRRYPGSRCWPWFGKDILPESLAGVGIVYRHFPALGGRRTTAPDSPNDAWRVPQFRAYADYMASAEFQAALESLLSLHAEAPTAVMCAEALPWRCHRRLISDAVLVRGIPVRHILGKASLRPHALPDFARVVPSTHPPRISYPLEEPRQERLI